MIPLIIEFLVHSDLNNPQVSPSPNVILKEVPYRTLTLEIYSQFHYII